MLIDTPALTKCLARMRRVREVSKLQQEVILALGLCGVESAYFLAPLTADPRVGRVLRNFGLPRDWERRYRAHHYRADPLPGISLEHSNAFRWPEDLEDVQVAARGLGYLEFAASHGLSRGVGVACFGPHGRAGFLGGIWTREEPASEEVLLAVHNIGQLSFQRYCRIVRVEMAITPLSNREFEVLGWLCKGKSNPVIAEILGVSRSTVDAYNRRIFTKLEVTDRTAACVRAHAQGLIVHDEIAQLIEQNSQIDAVSVHSA